MKTRMNVLSSVEPHASADAGSEFLGCPGDRSIALGLLCLSTWHWGVKRGGLGSADGGRLTIVGKEILRIGELRMKFILVGWMPRVGMLTFE